jgi:transcriptional regulator with XRE-family HTH domain
MSETAVNKRFKILIDHLGISNKEFSNRLNSTPQTISNILNSPTKPNFDFLASLCLAFPSINIRWILTGEGNINNNESNYEVSEPIQKYDNGIASLRNEIIDLKNEINRINKILIKNKLL